MGVHDGHREKMRQRFLKSSLDAFAEHEALEFLLYYAIPRRNTNELAHELIDRYGSLSAVLNAPVEDLQKVKGVGVNAALLLHMIPQLVRKSRMEEQNREIILNSTRAAGEYLVSCFLGEKNEVIYELCMNSRGKLLARKRLTEGNVTSARLDIRMLLSNALLTSASAVILAHNHPSGLPLPSSDDYAITDQAQDALNIIGVELVDHIIVADGSFSSLADSGYLMRRI